MDSEILVTTDKRLYDAVMAADNALREARASHRATAIQAETIWFINLTGSEVQCATAYTFCVKPGIHHRFILIRDPADVKIINWSVEHPKLLHDYRVWLRHHNEDIAAGYFTPTFTSFIGDQLSWYTIISDYNELPASWQVEEHHSFKADGYPAILKARMTRSAYLEAQAKINAITKRIDELLVRYPGIETTSLWRDFMEDITENGYDTPDDSDVETVIEAPTRKRLKCSRRASTRKLKEQ